MLTWICYVILVSSLLGFAALAAEHRARLKRTASRWYWLMAMIASLLLPTTIASVSIQIPNVFTPNVSPLTVTLRDETSSRLSPTTWISDYVDERSDIRGFDVIVRRSWFGASVLLLIVLLGSGFHLLWSKSHWTPGTVLRTPVLITKDVGPAVVGLVNPKIVVPLWVTSAPMNSSK